MKRLLLLSLLMVFVLPTLGNTAQHYLVKYGAETKLDFALYELDGVLLDMDATFAAGDIVLSIDEGDESQTTTHSGTADFSTLIADEGSTYSLTVYSEDCTGARMVYTIRDQSSPQLFLDTVLLITTYGNASAQHPTLPARLVYVNTSTAPDDYFMTAQEVEDEAEDAIQAKNLDHLMYEPVADRDVMAEVVDGTVLANLMTKTDGDTSDFDPDTDSLEALRDNQGGACPSAADIQAELEENGASILDSISDKLPTNYIMGSSTQDPMDDEINDIPTTAEFNARTIASTSYFDPSADTVANVTTVATLTDHTPQTGDVYAALPTNFSDLSITVTTGLVDVNGKTGFSLANASITSSTFDGSTAYAQSGDAYSLIDTRLSVTKSAYLDAAISSRSTYTAGDDWDETRASHTTDATFGGDAVDADNLASKEELRQEIESSGNSVWKILRKVLTLH